MATYLDTALPGSAQIVQGSHFEYWFGYEASFYLSLVSNLIAGQANAGNVTFEVRSKRRGVTYVTVGYGDQISVPVTGSGVVATLPGSPSLNLRIVISDEPQTLDVQTVSASVADPLTPSGYVKVFVEGSP